MRDDRSCIELVFRSLMFVFNTVFTEILHGEEEYCKYESNFRLCKENLDEEALNEENVIEEEK